MQKSRRQVPAELFVKKLSKNRKFTLDGMKKP